MKIFILILVLSSLTFAQKIDSTLYKHYDSLLVNVEKGINERINKLTKDDTRYNYLLGQRNAFFYLREEEGKRMLNALDSLRTKKKGK